MFLLAIVRLVLDVLSKTAGVLRSIVLVCAAAVGRAGAGRLSRQARFPHQRKYLDYDLTNVPGSRNSRPEAFANDGRPLHSMFRLLRRLAGLPEPYPVLVAKSSRDHRLPLR
jgi:hypothetical protein